jgi:light-regulated signal transduction histidine kinase (bacteriophytochrome)
MQFSQRVSQENQMDLEKSEITREKAFCDTIKLGGIHKIQSFGVLLILDYQTLDIVQYSENASILLKTDVSLLNKANISTFVTALSQETDISVKSLQI